MKYQSKEFKINGIQNSPLGMEVKELHILISNDTVGKTLSIDNGTIQFTIPMDNLINYLT